MTFYKDQPFPFWSEALPDESPCALWGRQTNRRFSLVLLTAIDITIVKYLDELFDRFNKVNGFHDISKLHEIFQKWTLFLIFHKLRHLRNTKSHVQASSLASKAYLLLFNRKYFTKLSILDSQVP